MNKYFIAKTFKAETPKGVVELQENQVIKLDKTEADQLLKLGLIKPLKNVFDELFQKLAGFLKSYDLTIGEITEQDPLLAQKIRDAVNRIDEAWLAESLTAFKEAIKEVETLYKTMQNPTLPSV